MPFLKAPEFITGIVLLTGRQLDTEHGLVSTDVEAELEELRSVGYVIVSDEEAEAILAAAEPPADKKPAKK